MEISEVNKKDLKQLAAYMNQELAKGRTQESISTDFGGSEDWLRKKLTYKNIYKRNKELNIYELAEKKEKQDNFINNIDTVDKVQDHKKISQDKIEPVVVNSNTEGQKALNNTNILQGFNEEEINTLKELTKIDTKSLNKLINEYNTKQNTKCIITDNSTTVTSLRLNKELYNKVKEKAATENIGITDIFNKIMLDYMNK